MIEYLPSVVVGGNVSECDEWEIRRDRRLEKKRIYGVVDIIEKLVIVVVRNFSG